MVSTLGLHWANDVVGALIQLRCALKPDGLFLGAFLGGSTLTELRQSLMAAEAELLGGAGSAPPELLRKMDGIGDAVIATDTYGRIRFLNPIAVALTGWSQADAAPASTCHSLDQHRIFNLLQKGFRNFVRNGFIWSRQDRQTRITRDTGTVSRMSCTTSCW